jgi:hypothetical protein
MGKRRRAERGKPKLPRGKMPPPEKTHRDEKKEAGRAACRRFRKRKVEQ